MIRGETPFLLKKRSISPGLPTENCPAFSKKKGRFSGKNKLISNEKKNYSFNKSGLLFLVCSIASGVLGLVINTNDERNIERCCFILV